eukprot:gene2856-3451_t
MWTLSHVDIWARTPHPEIPPNVFAEFSALANQHKASNLGQGFPSFPTPDFIRNYAVEAMHQGHNQYGRPGGVPALVETIARLYSPAFGRDLDPMTEVSTAAGAQSLLHHIFTAFVEPGEEVVFLEPYFDTYINSARIHGVVPVGVPMSAPDGCGSAADWHIDFDKLEAALTSKTRLLMLNTPHNPVGKVTTRPELQRIADIVSRHPNLLVVSDEAHPLFIPPFPAVHRLGARVCFMTTGFVPDHPALVIDYCPAGMAERTISLYSAGKTFSCTGWRVGYAIGAPDCIKPLITVQQAAAFCNPVPLEMAVARALEHCAHTEYYSMLAATMQKKRDFLCDHLAKAGMQPVVAQGGYFVMADTSSLPIPSEPDDSNPEKDLRSRRDFRVARWLIENAGVYGNAEMPHLISLIL